MKEHYIGPFFYYMDYLSPIKSMFISENLNPNISLRTLPLIIISEVLNPNLKNF